MISAVNKLPNQLYYYMGCGLIEPYILESIAHSCYSETQNITETNYFHHICLECREFLSIAFQNYINPYKALKIFDIKYMDNYAESGKLREANSEDLENTQIVSVSADAEFISSERARQNTDKDITLKFMLTMIHYD